MSETTLPPIYQRPEFKRHRTWWLITHSNLANDMTDMTIWGTFDTLTEAVTRFNALTTGEQARSYVVKNVAWETEIKEAPLRKE